MTVMGFSGMAFCVTWKRTLRCWPSCNVSVSLVVP
jgi:hypothetical protein